MSKEFAFYLASEHHRRSEQGNRGSGDPSLPIGMELGLNAQVLGLKLASHSHRARPDFTREIRLNNPTQRAQNYFPRSTTELAFVLTLNCRDPMQSSLEIHSLLFYGDVNIEPRMFRKKHPQKSCNSLAPSLSRALLAYRLSRRRHCRRRRCLVLLPLFDFFLFSYLSTLFPSNWLRFH